MWRNRMQKLGIHIHFRVYIEAGLLEPLVVLGGFIRRFKTWTTRCWKQQAELAVQDGETWAGGERRPAYRAQLGGLWQKNYHDRILPSHEIIALADKYIENNPLKWSLMHGNPPPLKVVEPLSAPVIPSGEWWSGVGRVDWLADSSVKFAAVRLSRTIRPKRDESGLRSADQGGRERLCSRGNLDFAV